PIPGATDSFYAALYCGVYSVFITDSQGCQGVSTGVIGGPCEVNELSALPLQLYPNPAEQSIAISHPSLSKGEIKILNMLGEEVFSQYSLLTPYSIDVSGFAKGIYLVEVSGGEKVYRGKFLKQ